MNGTERRDAKISSLQKIIGCGYKLIIFMQWEQRLFMKQNSLILCGCVYLFNLYLSDTWFVDFILIKHFSCSTCNKDHPRKKRLSTRWWNIVYKIKNKMSTLALMSLTISNESTEIKTLKNSNNHKRLQLIKVQRRDKMFNWHKWRDNMANVK